MPRHVTVTRDGSRVSLAADEEEAVFDPAKGYWEVAWKWASGEPPTSPVGSGVGEYFRRRLSDEQEAKFQKETGLWQAEGWLVPYDADVHGPVGGVLPLIAVCQEHKLSTPIRPCLDYRELNKRIASRPGTEAPACGEKIRVAPAESPVHSRRYQEGISERLYKARPPEVPGRCLAR